MDKTDSQIACELALAVHGGDPTRLERAYEAYQMLSRSAASTVTYRNSTANILARAAYHRSRDLGYTVIIGNGWDASAVSGKLNHVAVDECDRLIVCETEPEPGTAHQMGRNRTCHSRAVRGVMR